MKVEDFDIEVLNDKMIQSKYFDKYVVEIRTMIGDGVAYEHEEVDGTKEQIKYLIACLIEIDEARTDEPNEVKVSYPWAVWGNYKNIVSNNLEKIFNIKQDKDSKNWYFEGEGCNGILENWPYDCRADMYQSLESWKVFYYDKLGQKFEVEIKK